MMDELLEVETPAIIPATNLEGPASADLLLSGAIGDFEAALDGHIIQQSLMGGELHDGTSSAPRWMVPSRTVIEMDVRYDAESYTPGAARWTATISSCSRAGRHGGADPPAEDRDGGRLR
jgi:hypothetical protein